MESVLIWDTAPYLPCLYQYVWDLWSLSWSGTQHHTCPAGTSMSGNYGVCLDLGHSTIPALLVPVCLGSMESVLIWDTAPYLPCWYQYVWKLWSLSWSGTQHHTCPAGTSMSGIYGVCLDLAHSTIPALLVPVCLGSMESVWIWHTAPYLPCWYQYVWDLWSTSVFHFGTQHHPCPALLCCLESIRQRLNARDKCGWRLYMQSPVSD